MEPVTRSKQQKQVSGIYNCIALNKTSAMTIIAQPTATITSQSTSGPTNSTTSVTTKSTSETAIKPGTTTTIEESVHNETEGINKVFQSKLV